MPLLTDRARRMALAQLIELQEVGGFTLPTQVIGANAVYRSAVALAVPDAAPMRHIEDAAAAAVELLAGGKAVDPLALAAEVAAGQQQSAAVEMAQRLVALTAERAAERAVVACTAAAPDIIVGCLRPVFADVLSQAARHAPALHGVALDVAGWTAPTKVRQAHAALTTLAERCQILRRARALVVELSGAEPQHDTAGEFAILESPQAIVGARPPTAPLRRPDIPTGSVGMLIWLVTDAEAAGPWLPTPSEQDKAWAAVYGEAAEQLRRGHRDAQAIGARIA